MSSLADWRACIGLQQSIWGYSELEVLPEQIFIVATKTGGQAFGAFDQSKMVAFLLSFCGVRNGHSYLHSHMLGVLPEYRDRGLGRDLKLVQRQDALARNIDRIEWTFDPMQIKNAHFNIVCLGAVIREYLPNCYGYTSSPLHGGLPTDRLLAEWCLDSPRVIQLLDGNKPACLNAERIEMRPSRESGDQTAHPNTLEQSQSKMRNEFERLFKLGYVVTGFELEPNGGAAYVLEME